MRWRGLHLRKGAGSIGELIETISKGSGRQSSLHASADALASTARRTTSSAQSAGPWLERPRLDWHTCRAASHGFASTSASWEQPEVAKFSALASEWWNPRGPFAPLHSITPVRTLFIRRAVCQCLGLPEHLPRPLEGKTVLDVGCGGGFLSETLARLGATVTGIDPSEESIGAAKAHLQADPWLQGLVQYRACDAHDLLAEGKVYDAVIASEVIEHVSDPASFCATLARLTRDGGACVLSTISRTPRSYAAVILFAEYIARMIPRGTHDWNKFLTPEDLVLLMEGTQLELRQVAGMSLDVWHSRWQLTQDLGVNYIASFQKEAGPEPAGQQLRHRI